MTAKNQPSPKPQSSPPGKNPDAPDVKLLGQEKRGTEPPAIIRSGSGTKQER